MKAFHPFKRPKTAGDKIAVAACWGFMGWLAGLLAYPLIWQMIHPVGDPCGAVQALLILFLEPLGMAFPALTGAGLMLAPLVASRDEDNPYGQDLAGLTLRWLAVLTVCAALVAWGAIEGKWRPRTLMLFLLAAPVPPAAMILLGPVRRRNPTDGF